MRLGQRRAGHADMALLAVMRGTGQRDLLIRHAEGFHNACLDGGQALERLDGGARKHRVADVPHRGQQLAAWPHDGNGAAMLALDDAAAGHFRHDRIIVHWVVSAMCPSAS